MCHLCSCGAANFPFIIILGRPVPHGLFALSVTLERHGWVPIVPLCGAVGFSVSSNLNAIRPAILSLLVIGFSGRLDFVDR